MYGGPHRNTAVRTIDGSPYMGLSSHEWLASSTMHIWFGTARWASASHDFNCFTGVAMILQLHKRQELRSCLRVSPLGSSTDNSVIASPCGLSLSALGAQTQTSPVLSALWAQTLTPMEHVNPLGLVRCFSPVGFVGTIKQTVTHYVLRCWAPR